MSQVRSVDFLPEIFQTDANRQFLAATLDQLIQEPQFKKTEGFIGRRVGPGVNPNDRYVSEPTKTRTDYQLEPGVVSLDPENVTDIQEVITYPGINDALSYQGASITNPDRLYHSEYYTFDPFINFDPLINPNQYYWVPNGPPAVSVFASEIPLSQTFVVNRANGVYTFGGQVGANPTLTLVRGGTYSFQVSNNQKETINFRVTTLSNQSYQIDYQTNPTLTLARGNTYIFTLNATADYPFWIKTAPVTGTGSAYSSGVTNNGGTIGTVTFTVPQDAPNTLFYSAQNNINMQGQFNIVDVPAGTGPGFWIQTAPSITGRNPATPNIGTREVMGVINNGEDIGTVTFSVPSKTAQNFYYTLPNIGTVDLYTNLTFSDIQFKGINEFLSQFGGIDGITNLNNKTLVFGDPTDDEQNWTENSLYDPLDQNIALNGEAGSYDSLPYALSEIIPPEQRRNIWRIEYVTSGTYTYITLNPVATVEPQQKFTIAYGAVYSNTQWYKNSSGYFEQIPLLSAAQDTLYYQDGTDPEIFGRIELIEVTQDTTLNIADILGKKNYTSPSNNYYPNGVEFTNGMKVKFIGSVEPYSYWSGVVTVVCTSTYAGSNFIQCVTTQGLEEGQPITFDGTKGGLQPNVTYYIKKIVSITLFTVSLARDGSTVTLTASATVAPINGIMTANKDFYVSGVGTAIELLPVDNFIVPETYANDSDGQTIYVEPSELDYITIDRASKDLNAWTRSNRWFHSQVLTATGIYNRNPIDTSQYSTGKRPIIEFRPGFRLYNMGSEGKQPVDVIDFTETDAFSNIEGAISYTLFPIPVRDVRPINFEVGSPYKITRLGTTDWNAVAGTVGVIYEVGSVFTAAAVGTGSGLATAGYEFVDNTRVIFAVDQDPEVRNKIYVVNFVVPNSVPSTTAGNFRLGARYTIVSLGNTDWNEVADTIGEVYSVGQTIRAINAGSGTGTATFAEPIINLIPALDNPVMTDQSVVCTNGSQAGITFWYNGEQWNQAQQKTKTQQAPLFNIYDGNGRSLDDSVTYPSSTFRGTKLFSYSLGTALPDPVLGFSLKYQTLENIGDLVFDNNLYNDQFTYVLDATGINSPISIGCPKQYATRTIAQRMLGWQTAAVPSFVRQQFQFSYNGQPLLLDVKVLSDTVTIVPAVKVFVGSQFQLPDTYTVTTTDKTTTIVLSKEYPLGDIIEVSVLSDQTSAQAFYQVPMNLSQNPLNKDSASFTLGTIRNHYGSICQNLVDLTGSINGSNNTRDLGNIVPYGQLILQQSSPLTLAGYFMRSQKYNIFDALEYNSREYQKFKNQMLDAVTKQTINYNVTVAQVLDTVINETVRNRTSQSPFYWSDMLPSTEKFITTTYTIGAVCLNSFDTVYVYDYSSANYRGMNVYFNNVILTRGVDYTVGVNSATISLSNDIANNLQAGDTLVLQEYDATYGTFVPNTPTKLGLYPAWRPEILEIKTSSGTQSVIIGHDGSQTPLFDDIRDDVLLEFETRIYNNLKLDGNPVPLDAVNVIPGQFRQTDYSFNEINTMLSRSLLTYAGWNKLDLITQIYDAANPFTFNYSQALNRLNNTNLLGAWRGIYRYFYDSQQPQLTPWEMLGFSIKPLWWQDTYGPAPYTRDNLVLWDDLAAGIVKDPAGQYILPEYARPQLLNALPTNSEGDLLAPLYSVTGVYSDNTFRKSWKPGDGGPVEASWWNSSDYPFAVMRLLILTRPAEFFALFADRDLYRYNTEFDQYLYNNRYRLDASAITIYGTGTSKASYINWIVDFNKNQGFESTVTLQKDLANLDVRLCYRMASFSDKQYIKLLTEKSTPASTNTSYLIPDESYQLLVYKNQPFSRNIYSSVVIQVVETGWAVYGYSTAMPYFNTLTSIPAGQYQTFTVGNSSVKVPTFYTQQITSVPYGQVFTTQSAVINFLLTYGKYLEQQGFVFDSQENGYVLDWAHMAREFMYWCNQGWAVDSLINLNPLANRLSLTKPGAVVDSIVAQTAENVILDQNRKELPVRNLNVVRIDNTFAMESLNDQTIGFVDLRYTSFETLIVLNNTSLFGDLIYDPITGARQYRLEINAFTSLNWNGTVNAPGFILNQDNVSEWTGLKVYAKGEIVRYKNKYWSAAKIVQPSTKFDYNDWNQSDYTQIESGLLPNLANKANQLLNSYNINSANLESDNDLLSYGLIGFRPRQYMTDISLDDVSQLNVYRQFLSTKGTSLSTDLFRNTLLEKENSEYLIFENWAVQRGVYGANANRNFFELRLNKAFLTSDPVLVQVVLPPEPSEADQAIPLDSVWRSSFVLTTPDILPTTTVSVTDTGLPAAGYVNIDDVDITVFELSNPTALSANLDAIKNGSTIWVAKVNDYDWNIYRAQNIPGTIAHVCDNLDGTSRVIFTNQHGLSVGDQLIIKFFDSEVNGVYKVASIPDLNTVNIVFSFDGDRVVVNGNGIGFTLQTMRVSQASDVLTLPYTKIIPPGARVWVDNNGSDQWQVLEKQDPFVYQKILRPITTTVNEQYGVAIAQNLDHSVIFVGSPLLEFGTGTARGGIYAYLNSSTTQFSPSAPDLVIDNIIKLSADGTRGFGAAIDYGNTEWSVAGASASLGPLSVPNTGYAAVIRPESISEFSQQYGVWQMFTMPGTTNVSSPGVGEFGYSVAISKDEQWIYIGAPGINSVYAYGRVDATAQVMIVTTLQSTSSVNIAANIQINNAQQLEVSINGTILTLNTDYTVSGDFSTVTFVSPVSSGVNIEIVRLVKKIFAAGSTSYSLTPYLFTVSNIDSFTVTIDEQIQRPGIDYTYSAGTLQFYSATTDLVIVTAEVYFTYVDTLSVAGLPAGARFGHSVQCSTDGRQILVGCPNDIAQGTVNTIVTTGTAADGFRVYNAVAAASVTGIGAGAKFNITCFLGSYTVTVVDPGSGYTVGNTLLIKGSSLGGVDSVNDLTISVTSIQTLNEVGSVYVFDRNVQTFIQQNDSTAVYTVLGTPVAPVSVLVNNVPLKNIVNGVIGEDNTFAVSGSTVIIDAPLTVGDIIEIETNQFKLVQKVSQDILAEFSNFGQAVDLCSFDCSLYVGAPQSNITAWKGGVVQRSVAQARTYGSITATVASPTLTGGNTLRINNIDIAVPVAPNNTVAGLVSAINNWPETSGPGMPNVTASINSLGYLVLTATNVNTPFGNKLQVAPGTIGTAFADLGFETFVFTQTIESPLAVDYAAFGSALAINSESNSLVIGAPKGSLYLVNTFDYNTVTKQAGTTFDGNSTTFYAPVPQSGAAYVYDYLSSANDSIVNPGKFTFGQQISNTSVNSYDLYGIAISYGKGALVIGAPGSDSTPNGTNVGAVFAFDNPNLLPAWTVIHQQVPVVDIRLINSVYMYDRISSARTEFFDFFDPLQGKILGAAQQNLDYIGAVDPASYNVGLVNNRGNVWGATHVGEMWWDISTIRYIDTNQDNIVYASRRWGQLFPGSVVNVYQWVESINPPSSYVGSGTPLDITSYVINTKLNDNGLFSTTYYFWVRNVVETYTQRGKTLSASVIAQYLENPKASGIAYIAPINASTIAIYNGLQYINAADTIISIEFDRTANNANVHVEYEFIAQGRPQAFLSELLFRKLQDSFCGADSQGNTVPDLTLPVSQRYGVQFRPRQSMFVNRLLALKNYVTRVNSVLKLYPITEIRSLSLLNSQDPIPAAGSGAWNFPCANLEILSYQDIYAVPLGYKYLVESDSDYFGLWTIYMVVPDPSAPALRMLQLAQIQSYKTTDYWSYIDWYRPGFNPTTKVTFEVENRVYLQLLSAPVGSVTKVLANSQGKWELYLLEEMGWQRVGLQNGTIEISSVLYDYAQGQIGFDTRPFDTQAFDYEPQQETRKIIQAINQQLLIDELLIDRNRALTLMFDFILSEQQAPEWLVKTSLIDVDHNVRELLPFPNYVQDNQDFVSDYIQEVKPYHVQVREFNLIYPKTDLFAGDLTDFDVPAYFKTTLPAPRFVSPILLPYTHAQTTVSNNDSDATQGDVIWSTWPYTQWFQNYTMSVNSIRVVNTGSGYTEPPVVTIVGDCVTQATALSVINSLGQVISVTVTDPGSGYTQTPVVVFESSLGTGAFAYPELSNNLVRDFRINIKYDRCEYNSTIINWSSDGTYENGTRVRYQNAVWEADSADGSSAVVGPDFDRANWQLVPAAELNSADRTMGYYVPGVDMPGLELPLLIDGIAYPGVQVYGPGFAQSQDQISVTIAETLGVLYSSNSLVSLNILICSSTESLRPGMPISFSGTVFGNIVADQVYYVFRIIDDTKFTISVESADETQTEFVLYTSSWVLINSTAWNINNDYEVNDVVIAPNGSIRQAIRAVNASDAVSIDNTLYWNETPIAYEQGSVVVYNNTRYSAIQNVLPSIAIDDTAYWQPIIGATPMIGTVLIPEPLDTIYQSYFGNSAQGEPPNPPYPSDRAIDINVDGGQFVDVYEGHAPEELVNGSEFDTMDFRVYTRSGSDWTNNGHGFQMHSIRYVYDSTDLALEYSWSDIVEFPMQIEVSNVTTNLVLVPNVNYTIDYINQTIDFISGVSDGDTVNITVYQAGGGSHLYQAYLSNVATGDEIIVPVQSQQIEKIVLFVNGESLEVTEWESYYSPATEWNIVNSYDFNDVVFTQVTANASISGTSLNVSSVSNGIIVYGTEIVGTGITPGTKVIGYGTGIGDTGTYIVNISQTVASTAITGQKIYFKARTQVGIGIIPNQYEFWQSSILDPATPVAYAQEFSGAKRNSSFVAPLGITAGDGVSVLVMGSTSPTQYDWSVPITEYITADSTIVSTRILYPSNSLEGTNPANLVVTRNGIRLTPPAGAEWIGDSSTLNFLLPDRIGPPGGILNADVRVWVNNELQVQGTDYSVVPWDGSSAREILFVTAPADGAYILISVSTYAEYTVTLGSPNTITLAPLPNLGDKFGITTFNDTSQQEICTLVFVGPVQTGFTDVEPYSSTDYSPLPAANEWNILNAYNINDVVFTQAYISPGVPAPGNLPVFYEAQQPVPPGVSVSNTAYWTVIDLQDVPTSYDYSQGYTIDINDFNLVRTDLNTSRLFVTLDGYKLFDGVDYTIQGQYLILGSGVISAGQTLVVTEFTDSVIPNPAAFRVFQDMRSIQATYRITPKTTTTLAQAASATADRIYVNDINELMEPNLPNGIFGIVTIDGERIMYRQRDQDGGYITGLFRGTGGTAAAPHEAGSTVYDMGRGNLLTKYYQDYITVDDQLGDGSTTSFTANNLELSYFPLEAYDETAFDFAGIYVISGYDPISGLPIWVRSAASNEFNNKPGSFDYGKSPADYIQVFIGGIRQMSGYSVAFEPLQPYVTVTFDVPPPDGQMVTLLVRHGRSWYNVGVGVPSDGIALQETDNQAARFLCGTI